MTAESFFRELVQTALPKFNVVDANGMTFSEFLTEKSVELPSVFISYEGFSEQENYNDGSGGTDTENYSLYLRCADSVKPYVKLLQAALNSDQSEFIDENSNYKYVQFNSGQTFRDNGADAFEISVTIK
jgi:hypothetical protein